MRRGDRGERGGRGGGYTLTSTVLQIWRKLRKSVLSIDKNKLFSLVLIDEVLPISNTNAVSPKKDPVVSSAIVTSPAADRRAF